MWLSMATNKNKDNSKMFLPTFDCFLWPIIQLLKQEGQEMTRLQIIEGVLQTKEVTIEENVDLEELNYRVNRAFDILMVADILVERSGHKFTLSNYALALDENEVRALPRHIRTLDRYFCHEDTENKSNIVSEESIAKTIVESLNSEPLNDIELNEKLVKTYIDTDNGGKSKEVIDSFIKQVNYVKTVLKAKQVIDSDSEGLNFIEKEADKAKMEVDKHYNASSYFLKKSWDNLLEKVRDKRINYLKKRSISGLLVSFLVIIALVKIIISFSTKSRN